MAPTEWKMESAGVSYCKRVLRDGKIVGFLDQLSNGMWVCSESTGKRIAGLTAQPTAQRCFTAFKHSQAAKESSHD